MKCPFNFQHFQQDIFGNLQQFLCYVNNQLPENESPDIFYRFKLPLEGIPIEVYENQVHQDEAQFQTNYDQNYQMNQQPQPSQFAQIYQAQPQQEVLLQQQICQMQAQLLSLEQTTSQTAPSFQQYRQAIQNTHGNPLNIIVNPTKIDQYQDYHQILNLQHYNFSSYRPSLNTMK